jgi:nitrate reductase assembly molybdenum cofactor insertion protein NarJ
MASNAFPPTLFEQLAVLVRPPDDDFREAVASLCDAPLPIEATQQLGKFLERLRDLTTDELQELFAQTFPQARPAPAAGAAQHGGEAGRPTPGEAVSAGGGPAAEPGEAPAARAGGLLDRVAAGLGALAASGSAAGRAKEAGHLLAPLRELVDSLGRARNPYVHAMTALYLVAAIFRASPADQAGVPDGPG